MELTPADAELCLHGLKKAGSLPQAFVVSTAGKFKEIKRRVLGPDNASTAATAYNLGCIASQRGNHTEALSLLRQAIDHGLSPNGDLDMDKDDDLKSLHGDPRFVALVAYAKERATAAQKSN